MEDMMDNEKLYYNPKPTKQRSKFESVFIKYTQEQILLFGFVILIIIGAIILSLPISSATGTNQPFIDALFTSASAVSTTGLSVVDKGTFYNLFGQIIILLLIQVGGLGYMVFVVLLIYIIRRNISLQGSFFMKEILSGDSGITAENVLKVVKIVIVTTLIIELFGAVLYTVFFYQDFSLSKAIYYGIFHSISAFCTAGFSLFSDSMSQYQFNYGINITTYLITMAGGLGFVVLYDVFSKLKNKNLKFCRLMPYSKLVLVTSAIIIGISSIIIFYSETLLTHYSDSNRFLTTLFQSISASSTTGFNSFDITSYSITSLFVIIVLMFIGTGSASTGGGVKCSTFSIAVLSIIAILKGNKDTNAFGHKVPQHTVKIAFVIIFLGISLILVDLIILANTETHSLFDLIFEITSAFGTVGLSTGITSTLSYAGKAIIIFTMLIGRLGPLTIGMSIAGKQPKSTFSYGVEQFHVG
jgi:trk system potassium uptake protein TrkH